jgi:hypothetical protein
MLMLANILPLIAFTIGGIGYASGSIKLRPNAGEGIIPILVMLGACVVLAFSCWMIAPIGKWLKEWPRWHFQRKSKILWVVPLLLGSISGLLLRLVAGLASLAALVLVGVGLVRLWEKWG